jgi:hypothetical protein
VAKKAWLVYNISPAATTQMGISKKNAKLTAWLHAGKALRALYGAFEPVIRQDCRMTGAAGQSGTEFAPH